MKESLEDRTFEIIQSEEQKVKKNKKEFKKKKPTGFMGQNQKKQDLHYENSRKRRERDAEYLK